MTFNLIGAILELIAVVCITMGFYHTAFSFNGMALGFFLANLLILLKIV